jgi:hypothetical protein
MRFSVCMLCNEDRGTIDRFVDFYLHNGADEIFIYLDFGAVVPDFAGNKRVTVIKTETICITDGQPKRPKTLHEIQRLVYADAFQRFSSDWMLVCDVDEFILADRPLIDVLNDVPSEWQFFRIPVAEAVWGPEDTTGAAFESTYFRTRTRKGFGKLLSFLVYGKGYRYLKAGLTGHAMGKYFIRKSSTHDLGIHMPQGVAWTQGPWSYDITSDVNMFVYHFEAIGYDRWYKKWETRSVKNLGPNKGYNAAKRAYALAFADHKQRGTERELFERLYKVNRAQVAILKMLGLLHRKHL